LKADDAVMTDFGKFLTTKNVRCSEPELAENLDWVKRKIKQEIFLSVFGQPEGFKVQLAADSQVLAGIGAVPQARALYENARKTVAERVGAAKLSTMSCHSCGTCSL
jgi:hypothetical protein